MTSSESTPPVTVRILLRADRCNVGDKEAGKEHDVEPHVAYDLLCRKRAVLVHPERDAHLVKPRLHERYGDPATVYGSFTIRV